VTPTRRARDRRVARRIVAAVAYFVIALLGTSTVARADVAARTHIDRTRAADLASRAPWLRLLHFGTDVFGHLESEVDGRDFFLSPSGKRDPEAELLATLRAFAAPMKPGHEDEHALCRFPARREWLDHELHFLVGHPRCPALDRALASHPVRSVSFVYASNDISNPASAFGHTFLRLHVHAPRVGSPVDSDRRDRSAEFRAVTTTKNPIAYAFKGISGLFAGKVEIRPYAQIVEKYAVVGGRDLWEYDLRLTDDELTMLSLHLWELAPTELDYYYFGRNCAYVVLTVLEAAAPRLDLVSRLKALVFPRDALAAVAAVPGLVVRTRYWPSRMRLDETPPGEAFVPPVRKNPSLEHGPMRVVFGSGATSQYGTSFATFGYRVALHDLTDPPDGWASLAEVTILDLRARFDLERRALTLDRLTFANLIALHSVAVDPRVSWRVGAFGERLHDRACEDCFAHGLGGGVGAALATRDKTLAVFAMADAYSAFLPHLTGFGGSFVRLGVGPYAGVRLRRDATVVLVTGSVSYLPWEKLSDTFDLRLTVKSALAKNVALGVEAAAQPLSVEGQLVSYVYF
jgi:hypothetical protein